MEYLKLLSLKEWLLVGALAVIVGFHYWDVHEKVSAEREKQQGIARVEKAEAIIEARKDWDEKSKTLDTLTWMDHTQYTETMDRIAKTLSDMKGNYHAIVVKDPLPAGCFASPDRVQSVNATLGH